MTRALAILAFACTTAAAAGVPQSLDLERPLFAAGSVTYGDSDSAPGDGPLWVEVSAYVDPTGLATCETETCLPTKMTGHSWSGEVKLGDDGNWTGSMPLGDRVLSATEPVPPVALYDDYALQITAQLPTTPARCEAFCATEGRVDRMACERACTSPEAWAISGTTWMTTGTTHADLRSPTATMIAPEIALDAVVDASGERIRY